MLLKLALHYRRRLLPTSDHNWCHRGRNHWFLASGPSISKSVSIFRPVHLSRKFLNTRRGLKIKKKMDAGFHSVYGTAPLRDRLQKETLNHFF